MDLQWIILQVVGVVISVIIGGVLGPIIKKIMGKLFPPTKTVVKSNSKNNWKIPGAFLGFLLAVAIIIYLNISRVSIKINTSPDGGKVEMEEVVSGTSKNISEDDKIWVVVFSHPVGRYYPQNNPANIAQNGNWSSTCYFGIERDSGKMFDIVAVLANEELQGKFNQYLKEARDKKDWPGLEKLPDKVAYDRVTVIRK